MKHFINLKDIPAKDLRKILIDAKKRKQKRSNLNTLQLDKDAPLKGKLLVQMFEKSSLRTRLSFYLAIKQLGGGTITLRSNELHLGEGGESLEDTAKILSTYGDGFMLSLNLRSIRTHDYMVKPHVQLVLVSSTPPAPYVQEKKAGLRVCNSVTVACRLVMPFSVLGGKSSKLYAFVISSVL